MDDEIRDHETRDDEKTAPLAVTLEVLTHQEYS